MKILYMYAELMGYNIPVLESLVKDFGAEIHVIHWDHKKLTIYEAPTVKNVIYYNRSDFKSSKEILELSKLLEPDIAYVPNWYDRGYLSTCRFLRVKGVPVVCGLDNQWNGTIKQRLGVVAMKVFLRKYYSHMWVAGPRQYEFAKRLGFKNNTIKFNLYSADVDRFTHGILDKTHDGLKFLFVGRLEPVKGLDDLLSAWKNFSDRDNCSLTIIGDGSMLRQIQTDSSIIHKSFIQPDQLSQEIKEYDCFVLPSNFEPYGVVIHEFACAGMPLIISNACGAVPLFVLDGYNGYTFEAGDYKSLLEKMELMRLKTRKELKQMSLNSINRSKVITPQISAASLASILATNNDLKGS